MTSTPSTNSSRHAVPHHDLTIVMRDLNAKVSSDNMYYDWVMGKLGCGIKNENGERLIDFCNMNNLVTGGTLFPHQEIHKLTWCSSNGRDINHTDLLMINRKWHMETFALDIRMKRRADVGSDHHLVTAFIKLKLRSAGRRMTAQTL